MVIVLVMDIGSSGSSSGSYYCYSVRDSSSMTDVL